jgi:hypothetical protein
LNFGRDKKNFGSIFLYIIEKWKLISILCICVHIGITPDTQLQRHVSLDLHYKKYQNKCDQISIKSTLKKIKYMV